MEVVGVEAEAEVTEAEAEEAEVTDEAEAPAEEEAGDVILGDGLEILEVSEEAAPAEISAEPVAEPELGEVYDAVKTAGRADVLGVEAPTDNTVIASGKVKVTVQGAAPQVVAGTNQTKDTNAINSEKTVKYDPTVKEGKLGVELVEEVLYEQKTGGQFVPLTNGVDYIVTSDLGTMEASSSYLEIKFIGIFKEIKPVYVKFTVDKINIGTDKNIEVTYDQADYDPAKDMVCFTYDGEKHPLEKLVIKDTTNGRDYTLQKNTTEETKDYKIEFGSKESIETEADSDVTNVVAKSNGAVVYKITGQGGYTGEVEIEYQIQPKKIEKGDITLPPSQDLYFDTDGKKAVAKLKSLIFNTLTQKNLKKDTTNTWEIKFYTYDGKEEKSVSDDGEKWGDPGENGVDYVYYVLPKDDTNKNFVAYAVTDCPAYMKGSFVLKRTDKLSLQEVCDMIDGQVKVDYNGKDQIANSALVDAITEELSKIDAGLSSKMAFTFKDKKAVDAGTYDVVVRGTSSPWTNQPDVTIQVKIEPISLANADKKDFNSAIKGADNTVSVEQLKLADGTYEKTAVVKGLEWTDASGIEKDHITFVEGKDYTVTVKDDGWDGDKIKKAVITGINNFKDAVEMEVKQAEKIDLSTMTGEVQYKGTGLVEKEDVTVKDKAGNIVPADKYEVASQCCGNSHDRAGEHQVTIKPAKNNTDYVNELVITFTVEGKAFGEDYKADTSKMTAALKVDTKIDESDVPHNKVIVRTKKDDQAIRSTEYSWSYVWEGAGEDEKIVLAAAEDKEEGIEKFANVFPQAGTWKLVLKPTAALKGGIYGGEIVVEFTVDPKEFKEGNIRITPAAEGIEWPGAAVTEEEFSKKLTVTDITGTREVALEYDKDYVITEMSGNDKFGTATLTLSGKEGSKYDSQTMEVKIEITKKSLTGATVAAKEGALGYTGLAFSEMDPGLGAADVVVTTTDGVEVDPSEYDAEFTAEGTEAGTAVAIKVTAKAEGNYTDDASGEGEITQADIGSEYFAVEGFEEKVVLSGATAEQGTLTLKDTRTGKEVAIVSPYKYANNDKAGTATVTVTPVDTENYTGEKTLEYEVTSPEDLSIKLKKTSFPYTGKALTAADIIEEVTAGGAPVTGYTVKIEKDAVNAGTKVVIVTMEIGGKEVTAKESFEITPLAIKEADVTNVEAQYAYTGAVIRPAVKVTVNEKVLVKGTDYETYNTEDEKTGDKEVAVHGIGNYAGDVLKKFTVIPATIANGTVTGVETSYAYTGEVIRPAVVVTVDGKTLVKDVDYVVYNTESAEAGAKQVAVAGKGNYSGSKVIDFTVTPADITSASLKVKNVKYTGKVKKPAVTVTVNGKVLGSADYTATYTDDASIGLKTVTVTGKGNYAGSAEKSFKVTPAKAAVTKVSVGSKKITVSVKKQSGAKYQVQYRVKGSSKWTTAGGSSAKRTIKSLTSGKAYQVRVRAYASIGGTRTNGAWSKVTVSGKVK